MEGEFVPYTEKHHGFWKMFVFRVWYELGKYLFNISFSYCAIHRGLVYEIFTQDFYLEISSWLLQESFMVKAPCSQKKIGAK